MQWQVQFGNHVNPNAWEMNADSGSHFQRLPPFRVPRLTLNTTQSAQ